VPVIVVALLVMTGLHRDNGLSSRAVELTSAPRSPALPVQALDLRGDDQLPRVMVSGQAGPVGAYTTDQPALILITSLAHEASHTGLIAGIERLLEQECSARKKNCDNLWHAVLFYTVGEVARRHLGADYVPYAVRSGVFAHGSRRGRYPPLLEQFWRPYLEGRAESRAALTQIVESL
jgi:hypothetical protein